MSFNENEISTFETLNFCSKENEVKIHSFSSQTNVCPAINVLDPNEKRIWMSERNLPQHIIIDFSKALKRPKFYKFFGFYCWHDYDTNPFKIEIYTSKKEDNFLFWSKIQAKQTAGHQFFKIENLDSSYNFIKILVKENFGGNKTYLNNIFFCETLPTNFYPQNLNLDHKLIQNGSKPLREEDLYKIKLNKKYFNSEEKQKKKDIDKQGRMSHNTSLANSGVKSQLPLKYFDNYLRTEGNNPKKEGTIKLNDFNRKLEQISNNNVESEKNLKHHFSTTSNYNNTTGNDPNNNLLQILEREKFINSNYPGFFKKKSGGLFLKEKDSNNIFREESVSELPKRYYTYNEKNETNALFFNKTKTSTNNEVDLNSMKGEISKWSSKFLKLEENVEILAVKNEQILTILDELKRKNENNNFEMETEENLNKALEKLDVFLKNIHEENNLILEENRILRNNIENKIATIDESINILIEKESKASNLETKISENIAQQMKNFQAKMLESIDINTQALEDKLMSSLRSSRKKSKMQQKSKIKEESSENEDKSIDDYEERKRQQKLMEYLKEKEKKDFKQKKEILSSEKNKDHFFEDRKILNKRK